MSWPLLLYLRVSLETAPLPSVSSISAISAASDVVISLAVELREVNNKIHFRCVRSIVSVVCSLVFWCNGGRRTQLRVGRRDEWDMVAPWAL